MALTMPEVREAIARLSFCYCPTMPDIPHYCTRRELAADEADYIALYNAICALGRVEHYHGTGGSFGKPFRVREQGTPQCILYPGDGWRYWHMQPLSRQRKRPEFALGRSRIINRNTLAEAERLRAAGIIRS